MAFPLAEDDPRLFLAGKAARPLKNPATLRTRGCFLIDSRDAGSGMDQLGRSVVVFGTLGRSSTPRASSSVAVRIMEGEFARSLWVRAITSSSGADGERAIIFARRCRISRVPFSLGLSRSSFCFFRSWPLHKPAIVGRSWVVTAAMARRGKAAGAFFSNQTRRYESTRCRESCSLDRGLNRAQIFSDHQGLGPMAFQGHDGQEIFRGIADKRSACGIEAARDPVEPEQTHDVIDAQPPAVAQGGPNRLADGFVPGFGKLVGSERGQAPVLAEGVEFIGRDADGGIFPEAALPNPRVGPARVKPDGQVLDSRGSSLAAAAICRSRSH